MYCMECGAEIAAETKFCGKCGVSQAVVELAAMANNVSVDKPNQLQKAELKRSTSKFARNMKIIFGVVVLVMISPWIFLPSSKSKDSVQAIPSSTSQSKAATIPQIQVVWDCYAPINAEHAVVVMYNNNTADFILSAVNKLGIEKMESSFHSFGAKVKKIDNFLLIPNPKILEISFDTTSSNLKTIVDYGYKDSLGPVRTSTDFNCAKADVNVGLNSIQKAQKEAEKD